MNRSDVVSQFETLNRIKSSLKVDWLAVKLPFTKTSFGKLNRMFIAGSDGAIDENFRFDFCGRGRRVGCVLTIDGIDRRSDLPTVPQCAARGRRRKMR